MNMGKSKTTAGNSKESKKNDRKQAGPCDSSFSLDRERCLQMCDYLHPSVFYREITQTESEKIMKTVKSVMSTSAVYGWLTQQNVKNDGDEFELEDTAGNVGVDNSEAAMDVDENGASVGDLKLKLRSKIDQLRAARTHQIEEHNRKLKAANASKRTIQQTNGKSVAEKTKNSKNTKNQKEKSKSDATQANKSNGEGREEKLIGLQTSRIETFDDPTLIEKKRRRTAKRIEQQKLVGKDYSALLKRIERYDAVLKQLAEKDPKRAERVLERRRLATAIDRASGLKIRDNPELIKKSMKIRDARKRKSRENWQARKDDIVKRKEERQTKRRENLDKRKDQKKKQKIDRARKRGRFVISSSKK